MIERFPLRALTLAAIALVAGCSMIPTLERPAAPVAAQFPGQSASATAAGPALAWESFVQDARLRELIALSLQNNRDLRVAALQIERHLVDRHQPAPAACDVAALQKDVTHGPPPRVLQRAARHGRRAAHATDPASRRGLSAAAPRWR